MGTESLMIVINSGDLPYDRVPVIYVFCTGNLLSGAFYASCGRGEGEERGEGEGRDKEGDRGRKEGSEGEPEKRERGRGRQGREGSGERREWNDSML